MDNSLTNALMTVEKAQNIIRGHGGFVVCIEGGDGCGKKTQAQKIVEELNTSKFNPKYTQLGFSHEYKQADDGEKTKTIYLHRPEAMYVEFPRYDKESSYFIRKYLKGDYIKSALSFEKVCDFYALDRYDAWVGDNLREEYLLGAPLVFDRYCYSNIVYQSAKKLLKNYPDIYTNFKCDNITTAMKEDIYSIADYVVKTEINSNACFPVPNVVIYLVFNFDPNREELINERAKNDPSRKLDINEENDALMWLVNDFGAKILKIAAAHIRSMPNGKFPDIIEIPCDVLVGGPGEENSTDGYETRGIEDIHNHIMSAISCAYGKWDAELTSKLIQESWTTTAHKFNNAMTDWTKVAVIE